MVKRVLDVGNCDVDHHRIRSLIEREFSANVVRCHGLQDALRELRKSTAHLVLVNRVLDRDQSLGMDVIRDIKSDAELANTPCMLLTNFDEHQQAAVAAGAEPGFGKADLNQPRARERLVRFLA